MSRLMCPFCQGSRNPLRCQSITVAGLTSLPTVVWLTTMPSLSSGAGRSTDVAGDEFELQSEATTNPEREQGTEGGQKREHAYDGMAVARETLCLLGVSEF